MSALRTIVLAAILVSLALGLYVYLGQRPPVASGEVLTTTVYPVHTVINGGGGDQGMAGSSESNDQVLILTRVRVRNQTDIPLFLRDILMTVKGPDGADQENIAANDTDIDRVFQAYPSLRYLQRIPSSTQMPLVAGAALRAASIQRDITLSPGQSVEGLEVFNFPLSKEQWDAAQPAKVVVELTHQKNLVLVVGR